MVVNKTKILTNSFFGIELSKSPVRNTLYDHDGEDKRTLQENITNLLSSVDNFVGRKLKGVIILEI